jgi:hypothetical protein
MRGSQLKDTDLSIRYVLETKNPVATEAAAGPEQRRGQTAIILTLIGKVQELF